MIDLIEIIMARAADAADSENIFWADWHRNVAVFWLGKI